MKLRLLLLLSLLQWSFSCFSVQAITTPVVYYGKVLSGGKMCIRDRNMAMMANILKSLGCVDAMNLDGGGSTCMLVNGQPVIKPSAGAQRAITTAVALK